MHCESFVAFAKRVHGRNSILPESLASRGKKDRLAPIGCFAEVVTEEEAETVTSFVWMTSGVEDIGVSKSKARGTKAKGTKEPAFNVHAPALEPT